MRRDILAGCIGFVVTALIVFSKRNPPVYKRIEYSPFVHKPEFPVMPEAFTIHPASNLIHSASTEAPTTGQNAYKVPDGIQSDTTTIDELMKLPLESGEFTYNPVEDEAMSKAIYIKYVRFQCTKVRNSPKVILGGVRFLYNTVPIPFHKVQIWNPHTGESSKYTGGAWSDSDQHSVVFCFSESLEVNRYELKSSSESVEHDPVHWRVEGSMNGSFWTILDDRTVAETAFPLERNFSMNYIMKDYVA